MKETKRGRPANIRKPCRSTQMTGEEIALVQTMLRDGATKTDIAQKFGVHKHTLDGWLMKSGWVIKPNEGQFLCPINIVVTE